MEAKLAERTPPIFPETRSAGFVSDIDLHGIGRILDSKEGKSFMSREDIVYLAFNTSKAIMIGDKYTVFRPSELIRHPVTNQKDGQEVPNYWQCPDHRSTWKFFHGKGHRGF